MKLIFTHPARDLWLRLKALLAPRVAPKPAPRAARPQRPPTRAKHHRTTAFFEMP